MCTLRTVVLGQIFVFFFFFNNETDFDWLNQKGIYWPPEDLMESKTVTVNLQQQQ